MDKKTLANKILATGGELFVVIDPRECVVPTQFRRDQALILLLGLNLPIPIPDLHVGNDGITATLSFSRSPYECFIPWKALGSMFNSDRVGHTWDPDLFAKILVKPKLRLIMGGKL